MGVNEQGADMTEGRWVTIPRTLCFVICGNDVLLMKRAADKRVFPNRYNGVGGHIERYEDPLTSAWREIREETGLEVRDMRLRAVHNIDAKLATGIVLFVFTAISDSRVLKPNYEGTLHWIPKHSILDYDLVDDLPTILPRILEMKDKDMPLFVHVNYDEADNIQMQFAKLPG